jgi:hypothetical protein
MELAHGDLHSELLTYRNRGGISQRFAMFACRQIAAAMVSSFTV